LFWDLDVSVVRRFRDAGITVVYQVGSVKEAVAAEGAGAEIIVAQGVEAGGHVRGSTLLCQLLPEVLKAVNVPVLAAGGLATGDDLLAARAFGADGVVLGTVLAAAEESFAHPYHKQRLVLGTARETVLTRAFHINWPDGAAVRVLENPVTRNVHGPERPEVRHVIGEEAGRPIYLFSTDSPLQSMTGDFESMALYAGTGIDSITSIRPAGEIIREIAAAADIAPIGLDAAALSVPETASPVCYVGEMTGRYFGQLETSEIVVEMTSLLEDLRAVLINAQHADPAEAEASSPSFSPQIKSLARWIARLDAAWGPASSQSQFASSAYATDRAVERLRRVIPRLPESILRSELAELRGWLEGTNP
jgi:nitronate monooxygenase